MMAETHAPSRDQKYLMTRYAIAAMQARMPGTAINVTVL
jgi:hypothetical protein